MFNVKIEPTITIDIYMAGDIARAKQVCREYCMDVGFCVHIMPVDYIYTGGEEAGFKVGIVNYPRFPASHSELERRAMALADLLKTALCQHSFLLVGQEFTEWHSTKQIEGESA